MYYRFNRFKAYTRIDLYTILWYNLTVDYVNKFVRANIYCTDQVNDDENKFLHAKNLEM